MCADFVVVVQAGVGYNDCISFSTTTTFDFIGVVTLVVKAPSLIEGTKSGGMLTRPSLLEA